MSMLHLTKDSSCLEDGEPQLSAVSDARTPAADTTGPSPLMPALSPQPMAGVSCSDGVRGFEDPGRKPAKKMLNFGSSHQGQGVETMVGEGLTPLEAEEHSSGEELDINKESPCNTPRDLEDTLTSRENLTTCPTSFSPIYETINLEAGKHSESWPVSPPAQFTSIPKRPLSVSPTCEQHPKRLCTYLPSPENTSSKQIDTSMEVKTNEDVSLREPIPPPLMHSTKLMASGRDPDVCQHFQSETEGPENVLRSHGINLFENVSHRQELISFCEHSLNTHRPTASSPKLNTTNNNCNITSNNNSEPHHSERSSLAQLDAVIRRARARGFAVSDAVYFDGSRYVPIKVASDGRGKFRLLLPPDHPHRKGVADEIPIFRTVDIEESDTNDEKARDVHH